jgi:hypothetical protein
MIGNTFYIKAGRAALDLNFYLTFGANIDINVGKDVYEAFSEIWNIGSSSAFVLRKPTENLSSS